MPLGAAPPASLATATLLLAVVAPAVVVDLRERRIPNAVTGAGAVAAVGVGLAHDPAGQPGRCAAAAVVVLLLLVVRAPRPSGFGLGDVKLAGVLGLVLGPTVVVAVAVAFTAGTVVAVAVVLRGGRPALRAATVPFAPYLAAGALVALTVGEPILAAYLGLIR